MPFFNQKRWLEKEYYGNEDLDIAWDRIEMRQVALSITTNLSTQALESLGHLSTWALKAFSHSRHFI